MHDASKTLFQGLVLAGESTLLFNEMFFDYKTETLVCDQMCLKTLKNRLVKRKRPS